MNSTPQNNNAIGYSGKKKTVLLIGALKLFVFAAILYAIYDFVWVKNASPDILANLKSIFSTSNPLLLLGCLLLAPLNWILESIKWQKLTMGFNPMTMGQAVRSVLLGISIGIITPARVGEYGGRLLHIEIQNIGRALFAHLTGSIAQNLWTVLPGAMVMIYAMPELIPFQYGVMGLQYVFPFLAIMALAVYFNLFNWINLLRGVKYVEKSLLSLVTVRINIFTLTNVLAISGMRYGIYVLQYVLLIFFFQLTLNIPQAFGCAMVIFFLQTGLPLPPVLGLAARTQFAIFVLRNYDGNYTSILTVPVVLWLINLLIPSLIGAVILLKSNFNKYDQNV